MNLCPECGSLTNWQLDCPGYVRNDIVYICEGYNFTDWGKKFIMTSKCSNAALWYCTNEDCSWSFRIPNRRQGKLGVEPDWMYDPTDYDWEV